MRRPSPALVIAVIALVGSWGGPAVAQSLMGSKDVKDDSLRSKDVKDGSLRSKDVRDRTLRGRDIASETVKGRHVKGLTGRDILPNGIDGSDIDEQTLDEVPDAMRARRAEVAGSLEGARIGRIDFTRAAGSESVPVFESGGLRVDASCTDAGTLVATAAPAGDGGGLVRVSAVRPGSPPEPTLIVDNDFRAGDQVDLVAGGADGAGTLTHWAPTGAVTTIQYLAQDGLPADRGFRCALAGTIVHAAP